MTSRRAERLAMLAPFTLLLTLVSGWPLLRALWWAVHDGRSLTAAPVWIFTSRLARLVEDRALWFSLANTLVFAACLVVVLLPLSLGLALLLNRRDLRFRSGWRTILFATHLIGPVYVAGIVVSVASSLASGRVLSVPLLAMPIVLVASVWMAVGWALTYFLAALQNVDGDLLAAARVDGAGPLSTFQHITWPAVRPTALFVAFVTAAGALQLFELPFVLFQGPGPGNAALTLSMYLFSVAFEQGDLGYATAIGWALTLVVTGFAAAALRRQAVTP